MVLIVSLRLSVTWVSRGSVTVVAEHPESDHWGEAVGLEGWKQAVGAVPPCCPPSPSSADLTHLRSPRFHMLSLPVPSSGLLLLLSCPEGLALISHAGNAASKCFCVLPARSLGKGPRNAVREEQWEPGKTTARLLHFLMGKHLCEVLSTVSLLKLPPPPSPCPRISHP